METLRSNPRAWWGGVYGHDTYGQSRVRGEDTGANEGKR